MTSENLMHGRIVALGLLTVLGCTELPEPAPTATPARQGESSFDRATTGAIKGRVLWDGNVPAPEPMIVKTLAFNPTLYKNPVHCTLPHYPDVNPTSHGIKGAVVFLRNIDPHHAKPWDHASVRVEFQDRHMRVHQGNQVSSIGFVKIGSAIEIINRDAEFHLLRARGATFFGAPLQVPDRPSQRTLTKAGIVELTDAAGYYWLHGHLFVAEHPYYARTDADGRFNIDQVPAGRYELVCWMPSWVVQRRERDPETGVLARLIWAEAQEQAQTIEVRTGACSDITYTWTPNVFAR